MADLIGTIVAKNYQKAAPSSMFGTRELTFVSVTITGPDMTKQTGTDGAYTDADSYFSRAIRAIQGYVEVFFIGTPDATSFVMAIAEDTANDGENETYSKLITTVAEALGLADTAVAVAELSAVGANIS